MNGSTKPKKKKAIEVTEKREIEPTSIEVCARNGVNPALKDLKIEGTTIVRTKE